MKSVLTYKATLAGLAILAFCVAAADKHCPKQGCYYNTHRANEKDIFCIKDGMRLEDSANLEQPSAAQLKHLLVKRSFTRGQVLRYSAEAVWDITSSAFGTRIRSDRNKRRETQTFTIDALSNSGFTVRWATSDITNTSALAKSNPVTATAFVNKSGAFSDTRIIEGSDDTISYIPIVFVPLPDTGLVNGGSWKPNFGDTGLNLSGITATVTSLTGDLATIHLVGKIQFERPPRRSGEPRITADLVGDWTVYLDPKSGIVTRVRSTYRGTAVASRGGDVMTSDIFVDETLKLQSR